MYCKMLIGCTNQISKKFLLTETSFPQESEIERFAGMEDRLNKKEDECKSLQKVCTWHIHQNVKIFKATKYIGENAWRWNGVKIWTNINI